MTFRDWVNSIGSFGVGIFAGILVGVIAGVVVASSQTNSLFVVAGAAILLAGVGLALKLSVIGRLGEIGVVFVALGAVVLIVLATTDFLQPEPLVSPAVPLFVYVYALVGGVGYVFTEIIIDGSETDGSGDDRSENETSTQQEPPDRLYTRIVRVLAAVPLSAAVFLLAALILPDSQLASRAVIVETASNETITIVNGSTVNGGLDNETLVTNIEPTRRLPSDRLLAGVALLSGFFVRTTYERLNDLAVRLVGNGRGNGDDTSETEDQPDSPDEPDETEQETETEDQPDPPDEPDETEEQTSEAEEDTEAEKQPEAEEQTGETETEEDTDAPDKPDETEDQPETEQDTDETDDDGEASENDNETDDDADEAGEERTDG